MPADRAVLHQQIFWTDKLKRKEFFEGLKDGLPVCFGYLAVSFGIGILAIRSGLAGWIAVVMSATNLTSAGQVAGIGIMAAGGPFAEMILTQLVINCRYSLMGLSLTQRLSEGFSVKHRLIASFGITDEIFGLCAARKTPVTPYYMYGMIFVSGSGWVIGTLLGTVSGSILPQRLITALGILLYGMFIAIIIPPVRKNLNTLWVILLSSAVSCLIYYFAPMISSGYSVIISAVAAAGIISLFAPIPGEEQKE